MKLLIIKNNKIRYFFLPGKVFGNYWITDEYNNNLVNIEASDNKWVLRSNNDVKISNKDSFLDSIYLLEYSFINLKSIKTNESIIIYCMPTISPSNSYYRLGGPCELKVGKDPSCDIIYNNSNISNTHCTIIFNNGWQFKTGESNLSFLNKSIATDGIIKCGDEIFILGLNIIIGTDFIVLNNPNNQIQVNIEKLKKFEFGTQNMIQSLMDEDEYIELYSSDDYFLRQPRFKSTVEKEEFQIDAPPGKQTEQEMPLIYTIGPMITMAMTSMVTMVSSITNVLTSGASWTAAIPSILVAVAMMASVLVWPTMTKRYNKKQKEKKEALRTTKYKAYLEEKKKSINDAIVKQRQIVIDNNISLQECINIIKAKKRNLWEREIEDDDFLTVRIGVGSSTPDIIVKAPEEHFSLEDDELNIIVQSIVNQSKTMDGVPVNISLTEKNIIAIVGQEKVNKSFIDGLILQLITFHSYDDLKIVLFTKEEKADQWDYLKVLPHCWDNSKSVRFWATNAEDMKQISGYLEKIYNDRMFDETGKITTKDYRSHKPYYLIITDNLKTARNLEIVKRILESNVNVGFSLIIKSDRLANLPGECPTFINVDPNGSGLFENELVSTKQKSFIPDIEPNLNLEEISRTLANIPLDIQSIEMNFPETISFLQMYNIGKVEQLNSQNRWKNNNPTISLNAPIGVDTNGDIFSLDLHEKYHGPHGLIAGMTGSGKSEFIITYILSLAVNYHPYEVQFILIDYKGGGLAGAFENRETGIKLPHLAGTITNLDTMEMKRSLSSIQSELRRRQHMFNVARDAVNESTIDIYKYQKLYRDGLVKTPISHLFIISDEFAELKAQQPDFMAQLIQTARIGRSLGVHLILATQKPAGVVDDQIWSNSKFRVCLKVQDKSDSMDMIKCPDAALLKNVGRFYLQVGYNEFFGLGQSAWCGAQYYPTDKVKKKTDNSIGFINDIGQVIRSVDDTKANISIVSKGEELPNILSYLVNIAKEDNVSANQLWLPKIPEFIYVENLKKKYSYKSQSFILNPILGELDDPDNQKQTLITIPLTKDGNTIVYGSAGSGKELLLTTTIYSLITDHTPDEVNIYILDFGAETLKNFRNAPQVGDVIFNGETEKIANLIKMLQQKVEERKELFANYNGDINFYNTHSGSTLPSIVVMINNYEVFNELYSDYEDAIQVLTREGLKYGVIFLLTTTGTNGVKYRMRQNFKTDICLQMNDEGDYINIYGSTGKVYPSNIKGRGIIKYDKVYEFQTAHAYKEEELVEYIKLICDKLSTKFGTKKAPNIPTLPKVVRLSHVENAIKGLKSIPIGIKKNDLKTSTIDIKSKYMIPIISTDYEPYKPFITALIKEIANTKTCKTIVFDTQDYIPDNIKTSVEYFENGFDTKIKEISSFVNECKDIYVKNNYNIESLKDKEFKTVIIIGLQELLTRLTDEIKKELINAFINGKDLDVINFILIDTTSAIKKQEYEEWYKSSVSGNNGIYLGNGITDQFTIKLTKSPRELRETISEQFGYEIKNGIATLVKLIMEDIE